MQQRYWNIDKGTLEDSLFVQLVIVFQSKVLAECFSHLAVVVFCCHLCSSCWVCLVSCVTVEGITTSLKDLFKSFSFSFLFVGLATSAHRVRISVHQVHCTALILYSVDRLNRQSRLFNFVSMQTIFSGPSFQQSFTDTSWVLVIFTILMCVPAQITT